jgi:adenylosuccinate synthase
MDVVIGAAFGDEGKGLITHHLASRYNQDAVVVRFNGGAQAGHTVVTKNSERHIFRHIGSGTFAGAATFLSRFFISNPILFLEELKKLERLKLKPKVYIDPDSLVTTPYDMMINQMAEELRGSKRHGSCGVGFAETIERNLHPEFFLSVADLENTQKTIDTLHLIRKEWLPQRLKALNIQVSEQWRTYIESDDIFDLYVNNLSLFLESITVGRLDLERLARPIIFEGAQGLMLNQDCSWFPHVTRSHTGLKNVIDLIKNVDNKKLNVIYVTRSYLTRHGAGPLPYELETLPYKQVVDKTNIANIYQGSLRYAWFNLTLLKSFIQADLKIVPATLQADHQLAITCLDQVDDQITFVNNKKIHKEPPAVFLQKVAQEMQLSEIFCSYGPTVDTIQKWK